MTSLYEQIRRPWASWDMMMKDHDPTGGVTGSQLLADGDMEAATTAAWIANSGAVLSKETADPYAGTRNLRVTTLSGDGASQARQNILTAGVTYLFTGYFRTDGFGAATVGANGDTTNLGSSLTWKAFSVVTTAVDTIAFLGNSYGPADRDFYVEYDNVTVYAYGPRTLDSSGNGRHLILGNGAGVNEPTKIVDKRGYRNTSINFMRMPTATTWSANVMTFEMLLQHRGFSVNAQPFNFRDASNSNALVLVGDGVGFRFYTGTTPSTAAASRLLPHSNTGRVHLIGRHDGVNTSIWLDGKLGINAVTPLPPGFTTTPGPTLFSNYLGGNNFVGDIYLCRLWDVALTNIEIARICQQAPREANWV